MLADNVNSGSLRDRTETAQKRTQSFFREVPPVHGNLTTNVQSIDLTD